MKFTSIGVLVIFLFATLAHSADVFEIKIDKESHKFSIDAATFIGIDFSPDKFSPLYGSGQITFALHGKKNVLQFDLSRNNLLQVWHDKTELRLLFHEEKSFKYDKVYGDDITLRIITTSKDGSTYEGKYFLELEQYGLENKVKLEGTIRFTRSFRYHQ
jgi:hypothetical protein